MKVNKNGKKIGLLIIVIFSLSLVLNTNNVSAFYNWVEWEGYVLDEWNEDIEGATVKLKKGSVTLDTDTTDGDGYYFIREYVSTTDSLTIQVSKVNHSTESENVLSRDLGEPYEHDFDLYYVEKWAVVVGIDNYDEVSDLDYCENDAEDWFIELTYSTRFDFDYVVMYQDSATGCDGRAEEGVVKDALEDMVSGADGGDIIVFIFAGHGYQASASSHALIMWDAENGLNGEDGYLYDTEITAIFDDSTAERVFLFFDACYGSSFYNDINALSNKEQFFLSGADHDADVFVDETNENGCWTQCFLNEAWKDEYNRDKTISFDYIYEEGLDRYYAHGMQQHDYYDANQNPSGNNFYGDSFCLSKTGIYSPNS